MSRAGGARSRLARVFPTLADLRRELLRAHPECARVQAGGCPRLLPIAQVVCDWATPEGQRVVADYLAAAQHEQNLARYHAKRERMVAAVYGRRRELDEQGFATRRAAMKDAMEAIASQWQAEDAAAAAGASSKRSAA